MLDIESPETSFLTAVPSTSFKTKVVRLSNFKLKLGSSCNSAIYCEVQRIYWERVIDHREKINCFGSGTNLHY